MQSRSSTRCQSGKVTLSLRPQPAQHRHSYRMKQTKQLQVQATAVGVADFAGGTGWTSFEPATLQDSSRAEPPIVRAASELHASPASGSGKPGQLDFRGPGYVGFSIMASPATDIRARLKALGLAGVLAYGIFNTVYYICAFLFIWLYVLKVPPGLGLAQAARRFVEVFGLTWAGSQVTKVLRAGAALAFAPLVDRLLIRLQGDLKLSSKRQAFLLVVGGCVAVAVLLFCVVVGAWA